MRPLDAVALRTSRQSGDTVYPHCGVVFIDEVLILGTPIVHTLLIILFEQLSQNPSHGSPNIDHKSILCC